MFLVCVFKLFKGACRANVYFFGHVSLKPLPTGYKGIPFIVGERGIAERACSIGVC